MDDHPIQELMATSMESLKEMIEINTIIGDPVESPDGTTIIPVSKVGFGYVAGGSEFGSTSEGDSNNEKLPFGGGSGGGVSITPVAFLIIHKQGVKMIHLNENTHITEKLIDQAPIAIEKIQHMLQDLLKQKGSKRHSKKDSHTTNFEI